MLEKGKKIKWPDKVSYERYHTRMDEEDKSWLLIAAGKVAWLYTSLEEIPITRRHQKIPEGTQDFGRKIILSSDNLKKETVLSTEAGNQGAKFADQVKCRGVRQKHNNNNNKTTC